MDEATFQERLFAIRAALGEGARKPLPLKAFDDMIAEASGRRIHASELSAMEQGERVPRTIDVEAIAAVDPQKRGPAWLAFGVLPARSGDDGDDGDDGEPAPKPTPVLSPDDGAARETLFRPPAPARRKA